MTNDNDIFSAEELDTLIRSILKEIDFNKSVAQVVIRTNECTKECTVDADKLFLNPKPSHNFDCDSQPKSLPKSLIKNGAYRFIAEPYPVPISEPYPVPNNIEPEV